MHFDFFPSRTITIYMAKMFAVRILAVLLMLTLVLQMLDLLSESGKILAAPGNGQAQLLTYVSLRFPQLIAQSVKACCMKIPAIVTSRVFRARTTA